MAKKSITNRHYLTVEATLVQTNGSYRVRPTVLIVETPRTDPYEFGPYESYDPEDYLYGSASSANCVAAFSSMFAP